MGEIQEANQDLTEAEAAALIDEATASLDPDRFIAHFSHGFLSLPNEM